MMETKLREDADKRSQRSDIRQSFGSDFLAVGFFTPDHEPVASAFAKNLAEHRISHHLYARSIALPKSAGGEFNSPFWTGDRMPGAKPPSRLSTRRTSGMRGTARARSSMVRADGS